MITDRAITPQSLLIRNQEIVFTDMDGETVMMSMDLGQYYSLDSIASEIWQRLETALDVQSLCGQLCTVYEVDPDQCLAETLPFLKEMMDCGVIQFA